MIDDDHVDGALRVLAQRGAGQVLRLLHTHGGVATFAQLADTPRVLALLRDFAAQGWLLTNSGSLDITPPNAATIRLTAKGEAVAGHITRIHNIRAARNAHR